MPETSIHQEVPGDHNIFTATGNININYTQTPVEAEDRQNLLILLNKVKQFWIEGVLEQSVYHEALIQLGKETSPEMVQHPWDRILQLPDTISHSLPPDKNILEVFDEIGRALLILGEPGSGKTITMLELARELIKIAENDPMQPIPVVFNLSTWNKLPIFDWLLGELTIKYHIPRRFGYPWLENNRLLLLLDGLDEVNPNHRASCVEAINKFVEQSGVPGIAVCSRLAEYKALPTFLKLNGAICLQPLTTDEINDYLDRAGSSLSGLRTLLPTDSILQGLAQTPLMLNVMSLSYQDLPLEALSKGATVTVEERRTNLFDTYIQRMFERRCKVDESFIEDQTRDWLSWLSQKMIQHSRTVFLIEELQPNWLSNLRQFWFYSISSSLFFGLIFGLGIWLKWRRTFDFIFGLIFLGLIISIIFGLRDREENLFNHTTASNWSWADILRNSFWGLIFGLGFGLYFITIGGLFPGLYFGLYFWLMFGLSFGLTGRWGSLTAYIRTIDAFSGSWAGALKGIIAGCIAGLVTGLLGDLFVALTYAGKNTNMDLISKVLDELMFSILMGGLIGLIFGGLKGKIIEKTTSPNQGILLSMKCAFIAGSGIGLSALLFCVLIILFFLRSGADFQFNEALSLGLILGFFSGLMLGLLFFGGFDVIKHYTLRLIFWWKGYAPLNYAKFLDYATKLIFLRKVGGGYIFIHRMLMEHFAAMGKEEQHRGYLIYSNSHCHQASPSR